MSALETIQTQIIEWGHSSGRVRAVYGGNTSEECSLEVHWPSVDLSVIGITYHGKAARYLIEAMTTQLPEWNQGTLQRVDWGVTKLIGPPESSPRYSFFPLFYSDEEFPDYPAVICKSMFPVQNFPDSERPQISTLRYPYPLVT